MLANVCVTLSSSSTIRIFDGAESAVVGALAL